MERIVEMIAVSALGIMMLIQLVGIVIVAFIVREFMRNEKRG